MHILQKALLFDGYALVAMWKASWLALVAVGLFISPASAGDVRSNDLALKAIWQSAFRDTTNDFKAMGACGYCPEAKRALENDANSYARLINRVMANKSNWPYGSYALRGAHAAVYALTDEALSVSYSSENTRHGFQLATYYIKQARKDARLAQADFAHVV